MHSAGTPSSLRGPCCSGDHEPPELSGRLRYVSVCFSVVTMNHHSPLDVLGMSLYTQCRYLQYEDHAAVVTTNHESSLDAITVNTLYEPCHAKGAIRVFLPKCYIFLFSECTLV